MAGTFGYTGGQETQFISDFFSEASSGLGALGSGNSDIPRAYLNYILFDEEYELVDYGFLQISETAKNNPDLEYLSIQNIVPGKEGYIHIYVSNESNVDVNVWFDDLKITHINHSHIVQMDDYYPFGLGIDALSYRRGGVENRWLFNGIEYSKEVKYYLSKFRSYNASISRWMQIDPKLNEFNSPYTGMGNNPINYIDPKGDTIDYGSNRDRSFWTNTYMGRDLSQSLIGQLIKKIKRKSGSTFWSSVGISSFLDWGSKYEDLKDVDEIENPGETSAFSEFKKGTKPTEVIKDFKTAVEKANKYGKKMEEKWNGDDQPWFNKYGVTKNHIFRTEDDTISADKNFYGNYFNIRKASRQQIDSVLNDEENEIKETSLPYN